MRKKQLIYYLPYALWLLLFVLAPVALIVYQSFFDINNHVTLQNYVTYFESGTYLKMTLNSLWYAF